MDTAHASLSSPPCPASREWCPLFPNKHRMPEPLYKWTDVMYQAHSGLGERWPKSHLSKLVLFPPCQTNAHAGQEFRLCLAEQGTLS